jgi:hypothetical protein
LALKRKIERTPSLADFATRKVDIVADNVVARSQIRRTVSSVHEVICATGTDTDTAQKMLFPDNENPKALAVIWGKTLRKTAV